MSYCSTILHNGGIVRFIGVAEIEVLPMVICCALLLTASTVQSFTSLSFHSTGHQSDQHTKLTIETQYTL